MNHDLTVACLKQGTLLMRAYRAATVMERTGAFTSLFRAIRC